MRKKHEQSRRDFLKKFEEKFPDCKILEFTGVGSVLKFENSDGYMCSVKRAQHIIKQKSICFSMIEDKKQYIQDRLNQLFDGLHIISFTGMKQRAVIKDKNGFLYSVTLFDLLKGSPPSIQTCLNKEDLFKFRASMKHFNKYEYPNFIYKNGKQVIDIICPIHGVFKQKIECHLFGNGCHNCRNESCSFSKSQWIEKYKNKLCTFYVLEIFNREESFLKIGITSSSIRYRYQNLKGYQYKTLLEIKNDSNYIAKLESDILKKYKNYRCNTFISSRGKTETFKIDLKEVLYEELAGLGHPWISSQFESPN